MRNKPEIEHDTDYYDASMSLLLLLSIFLIRLKGNLGTLGSEIPASTETKG